MSALSVEERLHALEQEIARMKAKVVSSGKYDTPWLDRIAGAFEKNADFKEAMRLVKYRRSLRPKSKKSSET